MNKDIERQLNKRLRAVRNLGELDAAIAAARECGDYGLVMRHSVAPWLPLAVPRRFRTDPLYSNRCYFDIPGEHPAPVGWRSLHTVMHFKFGYGRQP